MAINWPDISQNQLFHAGLGLLGAGVRPSPNINPFQAASQGLMYGSMMDKQAKQEEREEAEAERRKRLEEAWGSMFGIPGVAGGSPAPATDGMTEGPLPGPNTAVPMPGMGAPMPPTVQDAMQMPNAAGMGGRKPLPPGGPAAPAGAPPSNPWLAGLPPQAMPLLAALGPEAGAPFLLQQMARPKPERQIIQGADGFNYYADTGKRVLPGVEAKQDKPPTGYRYGADGNLEVDPNWLETELRLRRESRNNQYINLGPSGIDYGEPEPGLVWARNPDGTVKLDDRGAPIGVPYQGGSVYRKQQEAEAESRAAAEREGVRLQTQAGKAETMLDATTSIKEIMESADTPVVGTSSRPFAAFSGTPAGKVRAYVGTLKSGVALGAITRLKEASATGATGFGALSQPELQLLIDDIGALDPDTTDPEIFMKTIDRIDRRQKRVAEDIRNNVSPERIEELGLEDFLQMVDSGTQAQDFSGMSMDELMSIDETELSSEELDAYVKALQEAVD